MSRNQIYYSDRYKDEHYEYSLAHRYDAKKTCHYSECLDRRHKAHRRFPELFYDTIQESVQRMLAWLRPVSTCRHVVLPREMAKYVPRSHLMSEDEWRQLGVQQSQGWIHYMIHKPEPHILLFRRPLPKN